MSAAALLERAKAAGVTVTVRDGSMKVIGQPDDIRPLIDDLRSSKAEILALLVSEKQAANDPAPDPDPDTQAAEPKRLFRPRGPWMSPSEQVAADAYHLHHFACPQCQAAGRGYSQRCSAGAALWDQYQQDDIDEAAALVARLQKAGHGCKQLPGGTGWLAHRWGLSVHLPDMAALRRFARNVLGSL